MENKSEFLCPVCVDGRFFRVVKSAEGIPCDVQYICKGKHGWDGKTCPNFKRSPPRDSLKGREITFAKGPVVKFEYSR
jgi:hypothetical protein